MQFLIFFSNYILTTEKGAMFKAYSAKFLEQPDQKYSFLFVNGRASGQIWPWIWVS